MDSKNPLDFTRITDTFDDSGQEERENIMQLVQEIQAQAATGAARDEFLLAAARLIQNHFPRFNWVGFYFLQSGKLCIGPYVGKPTPHTVIDLDKGVCGAAVREGETIVVDDVNADPRYLACSLETRSEIVIPIKVNGEIIGELDIDSDRLAAFGPGDRVRLEEVAAIVGTYLERSR